MPKRTDISTVLIIGAGPIVIGQACEFDYSGTQACKALKEEGYRLVLVNSNPATIMTDPELADATYIEPITPEIVTRIIEKERNVIPGGFALLPTMGGQTALNCALSLRRMGTLEKYDVEMIGATADAIDKAEDRALFRDAMTKIGLETPRSKLANASELKRQDRDRYRLERAHIEGRDLSDEQKKRALADYELTWKKQEPERRERYQDQALIEALQALDYVGLPAIIRPSFTLGGTGGGIAYTKAEFLEIVEGGLDASPTNEVLIEESVLGWKEFEMEVVRDKADNCIIICSIENVDPMGVHTGDSITIAPALTLTDKEYQIMRDASIAVLREIGVETGGSNVQFAVNPADGRLVVIEMNPRVSRSSALKKGDREKYLAEVARLEALDAHPGDRKRMIAAFEMKWMAGESERRKRYQEHALGEALLALAEVGLPAIIRPSFTLGGTGGGIAYNREEFLDIVERGLDASPTNEVLIEESVLGWKEYEMEVVRDKADNCIIICSIENVDPMGVHTGDSITVAPALTLTDKEFQIMRDASIAVLREIGVETGGSNVQFALN
ncbi:MAG TPA: hypothetical protein VJT13_09270, partial [Xanthobacteraceae bacterium]|nr:hypothetical protein [Xanthobacteraceae bacterium]